MNDILDKKVEYRTGWYNAETNKVLESLTNKELVALEKEDFASRVADLVKQENPRKKWQKAYDLVMDMPDHYWAIRNIFEGRKWENPKELFEAFRVMTAHASREGHSACRTGLAWSIEKLPGFDTDHDLKFIRDHLMNYEMTAYLRIVNAYGVAIPLQPRDRTFRCPDGEVRAPVEMQEKLEQMGVVFPNEYDPRHGAWAKAILAPLANARIKEELPEVVLYCNCVGEQVSLDTPPSEMKDRELLAAQAYWQSEIDGPNNDGRMTTGSSAQLDMWMDNLEEVKEEIERRQEGPAPR